MNEARRFIRYLFPGMIFIVLLILYLFVSAGKEFICAASRFMQGAKDGGGFLQAGVFILFVAGAEYFFATIYHSISKIDVLRLPDHSGMLKDARNRGWLVVNDRSKKDRESTIKTFSSSEAWSILGAYYHARINKAEFRRAHVRIESLNDTLHGLGASVIGSLFALGVWILLHKEMTCSFPACYWYILPISLSFLMGANYVATGIEAQNFIDGITAEFMASEGKSIPVYFPDDSERR